MNSEMENLNIKKLYLQNMEICQFIKLVAILTIALWC